MGTGNLDIWDNVLADETWRSVAPIPPSAGFGTTHLGGALNMDMPIMAMPFDIADSSYYKDWNTKRGGWAMLVPNCFLSEASFHTCYTPSWTQGDVLGEYVNPAGMEMVVVDLGGYDRCKHVESRDVRFAIGPEERAIGSEGGHGYGWQKRQHNFKEIVPLPNLATGKHDDVEHMENNEVAQAEQDYKSSGESDLGAPLPKGRSRHPIQDFEVPSDVECEDGMQDSTTRRIFLKVSSSLPEYMLCNNIDEGCIADFDTDDNNVEQSDIDIDSSDREWFPDYRDCVYTSDDEFDVDIVDDDGRASEDFLHWAMQPDAFKATPLGSEQLTQHYRKSSWNSDSIDFLGSRNNFTGPTPGFKNTNPDVVPRPKIVFDLYWHDEMLVKIVDETNEYAKIILPRKNPVDLNEVPQSKGGTSWEDITITELRS
jgi:hypothetical protein